MNKNDEEMDGQKVKMKSGRILCDSTGKVCYSQRDAGEIINNLKKHRKSDHLGRNKNMPKRSYICRGCGSYHLTHEPFMKPKKGRTKEKMTNEG